MNKLVALYSTFDGRIGRKRFWFGAVLIILFSIVLSALLMLLGLGETVSGTGTVQVDGGPTSQYAFAETTLNPWAALVVTLITVWPMLAITVKRRHDRNNSGLDAKIITGLVVLFQLLQAFGLASAGPIMGIVSLAVGLSAIYLLVVTGFLRGTSGTNTYGPDPLAPVAGA